MDLVDTVSVPAHRLTVTVLALPNLLTLRPLSFRRPNCPTDFELLLLRRVKTATTGLTCFGLVRAKFLALTPSARRTSQVCSSLQRTIGPARASLGVYSFKL